MNGWINSCFFPGYDDTYYNTFRAQMNCSVELTSHSRKHQHSQNQPNQSTENKYDDDKTITPSFSNVLTWKLVSVFCYWVFIFWRHWMRVCLSKWCVSQSPQLGNTNFSSPWQNGCQERYKIFNLVFPGVSHLETYCLHRCAPLRKLPCG